MIGTFLAGRSASRHTQPHVARSTETFRLRESPRGCKTLQVFLRLPFRAAGVGCHPEHGFRGGICFCLRLSPSPCVGLAFMPTRVYCVSPSGLNVACLPAARRRISLRHLLRGCPMFAPGRFFRVERGALNFHLKFPSAAASAYTDEIAFALIWCSAGFSRYLGPDAVNWE